MMSIISPTRQFAASPYPQAASLPPQPGKFATQNDAFQAGSPISFGQRRSSHWRMTPFSWGMALLISLAGYGAANVPGRHQADCSVRGSWTAPENSRWGEYCVGSRFLNLAEWIQQKSPPPGAEVELVKGAWRTGTGAVSRELRTVWRLIPEEHRREVDNVMEQAWGLPKEAAIRFIQTSDLPEALKPILIGGIDKTKCEPDTPLNLCR
jgi:hypothetical protein